MISIPITDNYDLTKPPLGIVENENGGGLRVRFNPGANITKDEFFAIFGNAGFEITQLELDTQSGSEIYHIREAIIRTYAKCPHDQRVIAALLEKGNET